MRSALLLAALLTVWPVAAQEVGTCEPASAVAYLDANEVRASIYNGGNLFWRGSGNVYTVPKHGRANSIFAAQIWIGGMVGDEIRMAATDYGPMEFWPGPLDIQGNPPADCSQYDRIYSIRREDMVEYEGTGSATPDLLEWPAHLGAPVIDGDGVPENLNLAGGDRPALIGDQMLWWVMNDAGNAHRDGSPPIQLEVQATAFAGRRSPESLRHLAYSPHLEEALRYSTFYRYKLVYHGERPLEDAWFAFWVDTDLGDATDDFIGSDSARGIGYVYNGDDMDGGADGYGDSPPALGADFFKGPVILPDGIDNDRDGEVDEIGERVGTVVSWMYPKNFPNQYTTAGRYLMMKGFWPNGSPMGFGPWWGNCDGLRSTFMYPGDPPEFCSEENTDGKGARNQPADRRFLITTGPFRMERGQSQEIVMGIVWARDRDRFASIRKMKAYDEIIQLFIDDILTPQLPPARSTALPRKYALVRNHPNPIRDRTTITYELPRQEHVRLTVYDVLGRAVTTLVNAVQPPGRHEVEFEAGALPPGVYFYELEAGLVRGAQKMVIAR